MEPVEIIVLIALGVIFLFLVFYRGAGAKQRALITLIHNSAIEPAELRKALSDTPALKQKKYMPDIVSECVVRGRIDLLDVIVSTGVSLKANDNVKAPVLGLAAAAQNPVQVAQFLIDQGVDLAARDGADARAAVMAAKFRQSELLRLLASKGVDIDRPDEGGLTALYYLISDMEPRLRELLDKDPVKQKQMTLDTIRTLLELGARVDRHPEGFPDILTLAVAGYTSAGLQALLEHGVRPEAEEEENDPLLSILAADDSPPAEIREKVVLLLKYNIITGDRDDRRNAIILGALHGDQAPRILTNNMISGMMSVDERFDSIFRKVLREKLQESIPERDAHLLLDEISKQIARFLDEGRVSIIDDLQSRGLNKTDATEIFEKGVSSFKMQVCKYAVKFQAYLFPGVKRLHDCLDTKDSLYESLVEKVNLGTADRNQVIGELEAQGVAKAGFRTLEPASPEERAHLMADIGPALAIEDVEELAKRSGLINFISDATAAGIEKSEVYLRLWLRFDVKPYMVENMMKQVFDI
ncbi:hypothetical protein [Algihabitans sp.]|uniref:hypothetical protein n=1 Tax=Algihabitans sp. TaxID=2821514 RepID=UPI003BAA9858